MSYCTKIIVPASFRHVSYIAELIIHESQFDSCHTIQAYCGRGRFSDVSSCTKCIAHLTPWTRLILHKIDFTRVPLWHKSNRIEFDCIRARFDRCRKSQNTWVFLTRGMADIDNCSRIPFLTFVIQCEIACPGVPFWRVSYCDNRFVDVSMFTRFIF